MTDQEQNHNRNRIITHLQFLFKSTLGRLLLFLVASSTLCFRRLISPFLGPFGLDRESTLNIFFSARLILVHDIENR